MRGGIRPGAGRKKLPVKEKRVMLRLFVSVAVRDYFKSKGIKNLSRYLEKHYKEFKL